MLDFNEADIERTARLIAPYIVHTPVHDWQGGELTALRGEDTSVALKLELFQRTGSFKARGALSNVLQLDSAARKRGVTAVSAGNHAIATAYAAQVLGVHAKVVMLPSANPARVASARALGADVLIAGSGEEAFAEAARLVEVEGRTLIHPFESRDTALGTATIGLEWANQSEPLDAVLIAIGGGGLCGGLASALKPRWPACRIYGVEPDGADTMKRSVAAGQPVTRDTSQHTIADSLAPPYALPYSFALSRDSVDAFVTVSDSEMMQAMGVLFREMKLAVEPAGAAAVAALVGPLRDELARKKVGILICGANIDIDGFADAIRTAQAAGGPI